MVRERDGFFSPRAHGQALAGLGLGLRVMERGGLTPGSAFQRCPPPNLTVLSLTSFPQSCSGLLHFPTGSK